MSAARSTSGDLSRTPVIQVMAYIYRNELSGTLSITDGAANEYRVYFIKGLPAYVEGKNLRYPVGELVSEAGLISKEDLQRYIEEAKREKKLLGQTLIENGVIDKRQLETAVRIQIRKRICDITGICEGTFSFQQDENLTAMPENNIVQANFLALVPEALRSGWSDERLAARLEDIRGFGFTIPEFESCRKAFGWSRGELAALEILNGKRWSLEEAEAAAGERLRDLRIVIYSLLLVGFLKFEATEEDEDRLRAEEEAKRKLEVYINLMNRKLKQIEEGNYFDILEVKMGASLSEIGDSYLRLVKEFHPDKVAPLKNQKLKEGFEKITMKLKEAFDVLTDRGAATKYLQRLRQWSDTPREEEQIVQQVIGDELAYQKALVLLNKKKWSELIALLEPIIKRGTDNGEYLAVYAWAKICVGGGKESITDLIKMLKEAVTLAPKSERANFFLALALQKVGQMQEYEEYIRTTVELNPYNIEAQRHWHIIQMRKEKKGKGSSIQDKLKDFLKQK